MHSLRESCYNLLAEIMNTHYNAEKICSLISFDLVALSFYFTYETLILMLIKFILPKQGLVACCTMRWNHCVSTVVQFKAEHHPMVD